MGGKLKLGTEKMPYALTDADLALWLEFNGRVGAALAGQPVRTDMRLSDMGILARERDVARAGDLRKTPLRMTATYDGANWASHQAGVWRGTKAGGEP